MRSRKKIRLAVALAFAVCALAALAHTARVGVRARGVDFRPDLPKGIPLKVWLAAVPRDNPVTAEKVALGRALYFDKRLSADGTVSCATGRVERVRLTRARRPRDEHHAVGLRCCAGT